MIHVDGSYGEGGGQILRSSLTLSILTGQPVEITRIRAGRTKPGLQPQHLAAVRAAAALCAAETEGAQSGSSKLQFRPQAAAAPGAYHFDIGTAGAAPLVVYTVLLPLALANGPSRVVVKGGTHVPHAPTTEYLDLVYAVLLRTHGLSVSFNSPHSGFFPRGGGLIQADIRPTASLLPVSLTERGELRTLTAHIVTSNLPSEVAQRGEAAMREGLRGLPGNVEVTVREISSPGPGGAIIIIAECESGLAGFCAVGARGKRMETVANEVVSECRTWYRSDTACDPHLSDQLVLPMALAGGTSRWTTSQVTEHLRTALWVLPQFLPVEAVLAENSDGTGTVSLRGVEMRGKPR